MEQVENLTTKNEAAVMPSYFKSLNTSESHQLASWQYLEDLIRKDEALKIITETYRKRLAIGKRFADEYKPMSPGITISAVMDGYGKKLANFVRPSYFLMLDFDHKTKKKIEECMDLLRQDEHVFAAYVTISGKGFRIFCPYSPIEDEDVTVLELFDVMIHKAMDHFTHLLGCEPDKACTDITRISGLAHDPNAFFRKDAVPFCLGPNDLKVLYTRKANETRYAQMMEKRKAKKMAAEVKSMNATAPSIEEAAQPIQHLLNQWGYQFESGRHNEYVVQFAKVCILYGIPQEEALSYAVTEFGSSYGDTASVMKSCYKHTEKFGKWHFRRKGEESTFRSSPNAIKQWLSMHYEMQHNLVTGAYELRSLMVLTGKYPNWTLVDDNIENSLWLEMNEDGMKVTCKTLHNIINSDFSQPFDPLVDYLKELPEWKEESDPDYIDQLADTIHVIDKPDYHHTQEEFRYFFKKWLVAMVVSWELLKVVNQVVLILVGRGGIFKTTFFAYLLPPILRQYFINDSTANYTDKDFMEACSSKAVLCMDEFECIFGKNLSAFKSAITKLTFSIRRPYDKYRSELPHRGSLCGTSNSQQFITDDENRRYSPWIVESIESPIEQPIDYTHVYAEAVALGKKVTKEKEHKEGDWTFWLNRADIELMRQHNRLFMVANYAEEQILRYYKVPDETTDVNFIKFRYSAEILERIGSNPALRQNLNKQNIGSVMSQLGFKKIHKEKGNGWAVIEKEPLELNNDAAVSPNDKLED